MNQPKEDIKNERPANSKEDFETMVGYYLASNPYISSNRQTSELEIRFGTNTKANRPISKINYENVIKQLQIAGFSTSIPEGLNMLRIQNEYSREGQTRISNIRAEIVGLDLIQEYCRTNQLQKIIDRPFTDHLIKFTQKVPPMISGKETQKALKPVDFPDFNFRVAYQMERDMSVRTDMAKHILSSWNDSKKIFRYINRVRFSHPDYPVFADLSIIKGSPKTNYVVIPHYTVQEASVFSNPEHYEIELEIDNHRVGSGTEFDTLPSLMDAIRKCIRIVLSGLQGTNYPISYNDCNRILQSYMRLLHGPEHNITRRVLPRDFIGPSSLTLQMENIQALTTDADSNIPNIRTKYTVTDKADGERKLLYISSDARIYMIDTNMNVIFTGAATRDKELCDSLLDGEHIKYDKYGNYVNIYAAFDIYYLHGKSVRELGFVPVDDTEKCRLPILVEYIRKLKPVSILDMDKGNSDPTKALTKEPESNKHSCGITIKCKRFATSEDEGGIFRSCDDILSEIDDGTYEYNTDGLIFTPMHTGAGGNRVGHAGPMYKSTWDLSFKWKPAEFNTIDFLVSVKKDKTGRDEIHNIFQEGVNMTGVQSVAQYKTLILRCGFSEKKHGYLNPMLDVINDQLPTPGNIDDEKAYVPVPFQPTNPFDSDAYLCNVTLHDNGMTNHVMLTEEHEYFEEDMIVEFRYDGSRETGWKWIPLRVRYDKTSELRAGLPNYGNAYHVANSNWHSIHNPITKDMITTGLSIPETTANENVYYNRSGSDTSTKALRNFHNLYVKRKLILGVSNRGNTLIDYAVGKAGDLPKWIAAKLSFVFGIDISKDNIENHLDGACARYLNDRKKYHNMPRALFVNGNSALNIRKTGKALISEKDKQIARAVFGTGPKDKTELGEGVFKQYGVAESGFNISSCQFALHYFFETEKTLHSFLRNLAECTKLGGYFIGTCYDGQTVFNKLARKQKGDGITIRRGEKKIYEIVKQYSHTGFPEDELSLGYAVDIYQESINKVFREFLVNFDYFVRMMENYGFILLTKEEAMHIGFPKSSGLFNELFAKMEEELKRNRHAKSEYGDADRMTLEEKQISFMNRYFIFKKTSTVDAEKVSRTILRERMDQDQYVEEKETKEPEETTRSEPEKTKERKRIRKMPGPPIMVTISEPTSIVRDIQSATSTLKENMDTGVILENVVKIRLKKK